jgi:hypothetical protein
MNMKAYAAGLCIAAIAATALAVPQAEAQTTQRGYTTTRVAKAPRPRARVTVAPRSFLDAGTEVQPGERKFTDYASRWAMPGSDQFGHQYRRQGGLGHQSAHAGPPAGRL